MARKDFIRFDTKELEAAARRLVGSMSNELYDAVEPAVRPMLADARRNAPERTGLLKSEIMMGDIKVTPLEVTVGVGLPKDTKAFYWWFQEAGYMAGNRRIPGTFFMNRAFESNKAQAKKQIKENLRKIIKGAIR